MLLAVDIGNTHTTFGAFDKDKLKATWLFTTGIHRTIDEYSSLLMSMLRLHNIEKSSITDVALCSVVPPMNPTFIQLFERFMSLPTFIIGAGVKTGVRIRMDNPREVGPDRIATAAAAHFLFPGPLIVIGFGTATTFNVINSEGDFLGGAIAPGISTAAEALFGRTAMLPRVELIPPRRAIATNTVNALQSGIIIGYTGLVEGMVARMKKELGETPTIIATGGLGEFMSKQTSVISHVNHNLSLIGIRLIYEMNTQPGEKRKRDAG